MRLGDFYLGETLTPSTEIKILQDRKRDRFGGEQDEFGKMSFRCSRDLSSHNSWSTRLKLLTWGKMKRNWTTQEEKNHKK